MTVQDLHFGDGLSGFGRNRAPVRLLSRIILCRACGAPSGLTTVDGGSIGERITQQLRREIARRLGNRSEKIVVIRMRGNRNDCVVPETIRARRKFHATNAVPVAVSKFLGGNGESERLDFKSSFDAGSLGEWCELIKDIVAFANSGGGTILVGINDDGPKDGETLRP